MLNPKQAVTWRRILRKANNIKDMQVDFCFKIGAEILNFTPDFDKTSANSALFKARLIKF